MTEPHGTRQTYQAGCHCVPCRAAEATYRAGLRRQHARGKLPLGATISAVEAWRRIRQLQVERVSRTELSRRLGLQPRPLRVHPDRVKLRTLLRIRHLYRQLVLEGPDQPPAISL